MVPITVIGSCRVYEPLVQSGLELAQKEVYAYTHNTREHLQLLKLGRTGAPDSESVSKMTAIPQGFKGFVEIPASQRFFVMEISSIRVVMYQDWQLQINRFFTYCSQFSPSQINALSFSSEEKLRAGLRECVGLPVEVDQIRYYEQDEDEIMADLREIHALLQGRVLFVPHFNTGRSGEAIWQRARVVHCLERLAHEAGAFIFDPTPHVIHYEIKKAIVDLGHYTAEFQAEISRLLAEKLASIISLSA